METQPKAKKPRTPAQQQAWLKCLSARNAAIAAQISSEPSYTGKKRSAPPADPVQAPPTPAPTPAPMPATAQAPAPALPTWQSAPPPPPVAPARDDYDVVDLDEILKPFHERIAKQDEQLKSFADTLDQFKQSADMRASAAENQLRFV